MSRQGARPLEGKVALVAGASRGAGRGIARALGEAGATVIVTGRSTSLRPSPDGTPGTVETTAGEVDRSGGVGIPVACDHSSPRDVDALVSRIAREHARLDVVVSAVWGGNERPLFGAPFWEQPVEHWDATMGAGARAHLLLARAVAPLLVRQGRGLLAVVSFDDDAKWLGNLYYDLAKVAMNRLAYGIAEELRPHGVASVALSPGHMRTERVLAAGVDLEGTESPLYLGRAVAALAADPDVLGRTGRVLHVAELAREYGFTDEDGRRPARFRV